MMMSGVDHVILELSYILFWGWMVCLDRGGLDVGIRMDFGLLCLNKCDLMFCLACFI